LGSWKELRGECDAGEFGEVFEEEEVVGEKCEVRGESRGGND
jgi:hypothetical protein